MAWPHGEWSGSGRAAAKGLLGACERTTRPLWAALLGMWHGATAAKHNRLAASRPWR
jgi:hypothetical protein